MGKAVLETSLYRRSMREVWFSVHEKATTTPTARYVSGWASGFGATCFVMSGSGTGSFKMSETDLHRFFQSSLAEVDAE
ncbi:hypothetical protein, partial [Acetobacter aceti]|uniref:hypothetical protein n=1 Tax=Acetobacter aceti TaxID=435 RepID=UPI001C60D7F0